MEKIKGDALENRANHMFVTVQRNYDLSKNLQTLLVNTGFKKTHLYSWFKNYMGLTVK